MTRQHFADLIVQLATPWEAARESDRAEWRGGLRKRLAGAGRKVKLVFTDRLLVTLICLRHQLPHAALADLYGVDRSTVSAAVREIRFLLAARGFAVPDQISAPPKKPGEDVCEGEHRAWREAKRRQSSARICIEHTNAELKKWRPLQRYTGRRESYGETHAAIASLVSDRSVRRATRRRTSTALVPVRTNTC
ncbi:transposase family protein [Streptomyces sp. NPDC057579]|uniref:transposase family protein n=1 Tax=Streptomyces sp. NPDC057579 TaxID=3346172 RepID=UPI003694A2AF